MTNHLMDTQLYAGKERRHWLMGEQASASINTAEKTVWLNSHEIARGIDALEAVSRNPSQGCVLTPEDNESPQMVLLQDRGGVGYNPYMVTGTETYGFEAVAYPGMEAIVFDKKSRDQYITVPSGTTVTYFSHAGDQADLHELQDMHYPNTAKIVAAIAAAEKAPDLTQIKRRRPRRFPLRGLLRS